MVGVCGWESELVLNNEGTENGVYKKFRVEEAERADTLGWRWGAHR